MQQGWHVRRGETAEEMIRNCNEKNLSCTLQLYNSNPVGARCSWCSTIYSESKIQLKVPPTPPHPHGFVSVRLTLDSDNWESLRDSDGPTSSLFTAFAAAPLMLAGQRHDTSAAIVELTLLHERRCGSSLPLPCSDRRATALVFSPRSSHSQVRAAPHTSAELPNRGLVTTKGRSYRQARSQRRSVRAALQTPQSLTWMLFSLFDCPPHNEQRIQADLFLLVCACVSCCGILVMTDLCILGVYLFLRTSFELI